MEIPGTVDIVNNGFYDWLRAEVQTSRVERNRVLDEFDKAIEGLEGGWEHPYNFTARKAESHTDRLGPWFEAFTLEPDDDFQAARIIFAGLMQISGGYRNQCYVEASDAADYIKRREKGVGIDLRQPISARLHINLKGAADFLDARMTLEQLDERRRSIETIGIKVTQSMAELVRLDKDNEIKRYRTRATLEAQTAQFSWAAFTTDALTLVAKMRGGLAGVPLLEPRSISDQSGITYYPFKETIDWASVLTDAKPQGSV